MSMHSSLKSLITLRKCGFPQDIIDTIMDFTFINIVCQTKNYKKKILQLFSSVGNIDGNNGYYIFWIKKDFRKDSEERAICELFCTKCGDYASWREIEMKNISSNAKCRCIYS